MRMSGRDQAHLIRAQVLSFLRNESLLRAIESSHATDFIGAKFERAVSPQAAMAIRRDITDDPTRRYEYWLLDSAQDVSAVSAEEFQAAAPDRRFSRNFCLRKPDRSAMALRGFLSAVVSAEARTILSKAYGQDLRFASADMAMYGQGDYLRRHADVFSNRRLGLVWFMNTDPPTGAGGELVIESASGAGLVVTPSEGSVALIPIRPDHSHLVASVRDGSWLRCSIATHYAAAS